jgi:hypothetical protein
LLDQPVGQSRLPMIYVRDYAKVANKREFSHAAPLAGPPRAFKHGGKAVGGLGGWGARWRVWESGLWRNIGLRGEQ